MPLPLTYVWGVVPSDNGELLDPNDNGTLVMDNTFNMSSYDSLVWMADFCETQRTNNYTLLQNKVCSLTLYLQSLTAPCNRYICCGHKNASLGNFQRCFPPFMAELYAKTPTEDILGIPYFDSSNDVRAFTMTYITTWSFTTKYSDMKLFVDYVDQQLAVRQVAPKEIQNVFASSVFFYFDTQRAFVKGVYQSAGISMIVAIGCMFLTTRSFLISLYSIFNIAQASITIVAILVLLGWKLYVLESLIISLAVGLTIDFVIHFGVAYNLSKEDTRGKRVLDVLNAVGCSASMAALTSFLAGVAMLPSTVYCYYQFGIFLMLCMVVSLAYSIFFFLPLCHWIGPVGPMAKIPLPKCCKETKSQATPNEERSLDENPLSEDRALSGTDRALSEADRVLSNRSEFANRWSPSDDCQISHMDTSFEQDSLLCDRLELSDDKNISPLNETVI